MRTDDLVGAVWLPGDGKANPADITQALAKGARNGGVRIFEKTRVTAIDTKDGRVTGVQTTEGPIAAEIVVNCAGQWARQVGRMVGVTVPLYSCEHMYIVTEKMEGVPRDLPVMRDPDGYIYFKEEVGGLLMGGFEPEAKPWNKDVIPDDFEFGMLPDDWDQFQILMDNALIRVPALEKTGIKTFMNGPESFTPDLNYILGEAPQLKGFFVGAGLQLDGHRQLGRRRHGAGRMDRRRRADARSVAGRHPPLRQLPRQRCLAARPGRRDARPALQDAVAAARARERPAVPPLAALRPAEGARRLVRQQDGLGPAELVRRHRQDAGHAVWLGPRRLVRRGRRRAQGDARGGDGRRRDLVRQVPGAGPRRRAALQRLCANDIAVPVGRTVYTGMLNERGTFESDLTIARLARDKFMVITGSAQVMRDCRLDRQQRRRGRACHADRRHLALDRAVGDGAEQPRAAAEGQPADFSNEAFPFATIREIGVGYATVLASRRTYMGELGWELYVPVEFAVTVFETLHGAGAEFGLRDAGYYAIEGLRIEKAYRAWGRELTPDDTPWQAGLGWAVKLDKPGGFIGQKALVEAKAKPLARRLVSVVLEDGEPLLWGGEALLRDGKPVGDLTSAALRPHGRRRRSAWAT